MIYRYKHDNKPTQKGLNVNYILKDGSKVCSHAHGLHPRD